jgi:hypothetical protein
LWVERYLHDVTEESAWGIERPQISVGPEDRLHAVLSRGEGRNLFEWKERGRRAFDRDSAAGRERGSVDAECGHGTAPGACDETSRLDAGAAFGQDNEQSTGRLCRQRRVQDDVHLKVL